MSWESISLSDALRPLKSSPFTRDELNYSSGQYQNVHYGDILVRFPSVVDAKEEGLPYVSDSAEGRCSRCSLLQNGDIIIADTAEDEAVGKAIEIQGITDQKVVSGLHTMAFRPQEGLFAPGFLGYFLNSSVYHNQLLPLMQGIKVLSISKTAIGDTVIKYPSYIEQEKIVESLSGVDDIIGALDEAIAKKQQIKEGLMQQLLTGKTRLPGFDREWREAELKEFGYMIRGVSYKPEDSSLKPEDGYVRLLRSNNIQEGKMVYADYVYVKSANVADYQYMKNGDILICMANGSKQLVGKAARLTRSGVYTFGAFMGVFRCNDKTVCPFVGELLKTGYYRKLLDDILTGSAINNLNGAAVESLKFFVPSDSQEQRAIADVLCKVDDEINGLECQRDKYRLIKQGMMQELLTGKIRL